MARIPLSGILSITVTFLLFAHNTNASRRKEMCSFLKSYHAGMTPECPRTNFLCDSGKCIQRSWYCDGGNDCGDNSDEEYCRTNSRNECSEKRKQKCPQSNKCIPKFFFCDGITDCPNGEDELRCAHSTLAENAVNASIKCLQWLRNQRKPQLSTETWGSLVEKSAIALYLADHTFSEFRNGTKKELAYEVSIQLLSRLFRTKLQDIPSTELASFVNAFLVSCLDPRKFHGIDLVKELRTRVEQQSFTNPYVLLSLCNAGETIRESDKVKLLDTFRNKRRTFWTDMQAVVVMALSCASKQPESDVDQETLHELTMELKQHQYRNGSVENLQTTALVMQALLASEPDEDPDNFDEGRAMEQIIFNQQPDGSFGSLMNAYFVLPVLNCKSLVNISSDHCKSVKRDETSAMVNLAKINGTKKRIQYSIWIGNEKDLERNLILRVPENMSFYGIMEIAAEIDSRYSFQYVVKNRKPYVNAVSELQDNPEQGKFWFLYTLKDEQATPSQESPADVIPKDNEHFVMWYRSGSWVD